ncbi:MULTISPECIES: ferritin-like domain-containing protein [Paraglaciecola]|uniref:ferritin-like domain-containing protein n=1 Tax=Paraglaciecola TaxID=1621534 RepID=UPI00105B935B|nr:PA2169 family four-helix-bundle protein [Paraglaciecola marina]
MQTQIKQVEKVSDVIQVVKAGIDFYESAITEVESPEVKTIFSNMVTKKKQVISKLQPLAIAEQGEVEKGSSWAVNARKVYTDFLGTFSKNEDHTYVSQLEEVEDKILETLDEAISEKQPTQAMTTLLSAKVEAQAMHDQMKALQHITKH